jgi:hypothetical protein
VSTLDTLPAHPVVIFQELIQVVSGRQTYGKMQQHGSEGWFEAAEEKDIFRHA